MDENLNVKFLAAAPLLQHNEIFSCMLPTDNAKAKSQKRKMFFAKIYLQQAQFMVQCMLEIYVTLSEEEI